MKIKGHSIIELTDVKTGKVERYSDNNMLTNAIDYYLQDVGLANQNPVFTTDVRNNLVNQLMGGLLLLDENLTESAENIICPSGVKMVGNGSYNETSTAEDGVTEFGSWNATESKWMSDGSYKMVWDFRTDQANGVIKCACLTSANHGFIGEGNSTSGAAKPRNGTGRRSDYTYSGSASSILIDSGSSQGRRIVHASRTNNTITMIDEYNLIRTTDHINEHMSETGKIKLKTYIAPFKKIDIRYNQAQSYMPATVTEVSIPSAFVTALNHGNPYWYHKMGDTFCIVTGLVGVDYGQGQWARIQANGTMHILRINANNTLSYFAIPNPKGSANLDLLIDSILVSTDTLAFSENGNNTWFIDLSDTTDVSKVTDWSYNSIDFFYPSANVAFADSAKIDLGTRKVYYANCWRNSGDNSQCNTYLNDNPLTNSYLFGTGISKSTNYLATINNLSEPVTKTDNKTMKVTYTLSFDDND